MSKKIIVFFVDDHKAIFERDNVVFKCDDGSMFTLSETYRVYKVDGVRPEMADGEKILINWRSVCFVRAYDDRLAEDDD